MSIRKALPLIVFVVFSAGMFVLCMNSHIDFFPCEITEVERNSWGQRRPVTRSGECSVMHHERLTAAGWGLAIAFCAGIGGAAAGITYAFTRRKRA